MRDQRMLAGSFAVAAVVGLAGCSTDEAEPEPDHAAAIEAVIVDNQTGAGDPEVECVDTVTPGFTERLFGGVEECRSAIEESAGTPAEEVGVSAIEIDGAKATARVALVGGDFDGAAGIFDLVKDDERWRIDGFDGEFARSSIASRLTTTSEDTGLDDEGVRCAMGVLGPRLADGESATAYFIDLVRSDEAAVAAYQDAVVLCRPIEVGNSGSATRDTFEEGFYVYLVDRSGASEDKATCIIGQLRHGLSEAEVQSWVQALADGAEEPRDVLAKVQTAALNCANVG